MSGKARPVRTAVRCYRLLVRLCPRNFTQHPSEMVRDFAHELDSEFLARGFPGYFRYCLGALLDTVVTAVVAWWTILADALAQSAREWGGVRYTLRSLRSTWLLSTMAVLTIALGVGLTTTTFSIVYGVLLNPLPIEGSARWMAVELTALEGRGGNPQFEALDLRDFRERQTSFEGLDGYLRRRVSVAGPGATGPGAAGPGATGPGAAGPGATGPVVAGTDAQSLAAGFVTASALERLGVRPLLGRTFLPGEDFTRDIRHVILGHDVWRSRYGGAEDVIGTEIRVDGRHLEVIGVMPAGFRFPVAEQLWLPMDFDLPTVDRGSGRSFSVFGRLRDGVGIEAARAEAHAIAGHIAAENPDQHPPLGAEVFPFAERHIPRGIASMLQVMLAAVFGVLLIACVNVANLLLARSLTRFHEVSIKSALGANRFQIAHLFFMEALVLAVPGCLLGLGLSALGLDSVERWAPDLSLPYWVDVSVSAPALWLTAGSIAFVALAAGSLPAIRAARSDPASTINDTRGSTDRRLGGVGRTLVTGQIALSFALLIGAGLLFKNLIHLRTLDMGYDADRVLAAHLRFPTAENREGAARSALFAEVLERSSALPGVRRTSLARGTPGTGRTFSWDFEVRGEDYGAGAYPVADGAPVAHDYFRVLGIELLRGRDFTAAESRFGTESVLIVNETLARRHLGPDPVGRQIRIGGGRGDSPWRTVVGVVADTFIGSSSGGIGMGEAPREQIYISWGCAPYSAGTLLVRSEREPERLIPELRALLRQVAPDVPLHNPARLSDTIEDSTWAFGLFGTVFAVFGAMALLMSAVGLYGVIAFSVHQRRSEMAVRMALGADRRKILGMVLGDAGRRLLWGAGLGLALSVGLSRGIRGALFGVEALDLTVYATVLGAVTGICILAALLPAHRAARSDPAIRLGR